MEMGSKAFSSSMLDRHLRSLAAWVVLVSTYSTLCLAMQHPVRHAHSRHKRQHQHTDQSSYTPTSFIIDGRGGPQYGDWGPWSDPSDCSRTCGGGVAFQTRVCRDIRSDGSTGCVGGAKRYFSCNIQDCRSSTDFRTEQCEEFNRVPFEDKYYDWIPYTKGINRCELNCMPRGERFYYQHKKKVVDGTRCFDDEKLDICVDGQCLPVGCDGLLGSDAREDNCRECGGDGSSCTTISGLLKDTDLQVGYNDILLIPAGATNIKIREIGPTNNYLAVRNQTGHYYLNGNWRIDFPRDLRFCGTVFHYERKPHGFYAPEALTAVGPITEALYIVLLYQEPNPGITFEYSAPKGVSARNDPENYAWVYGEFGECSATCGGGVQERNVTCLRKRDSVQVANNLCDSNYEPPLIQACAPEPCPPRWATSAWAPCSESCKKGVQERQVYCEQVISNGLPSVANESLCDELGNKPQSKQDCNEKVVCPQWHIGPWKPCNKLCGEGKQTREVKCYEKVEGRIQVLPDLACPEAKPESEKECMLRPCDGVDWITSEWSGCEDACGLTQETRSAQCATQQGVIFPDSFCHEYRKPELVRACETVKKCEFEWFAGQWSKCSSRCGAGVQSRKVFCGSFQSDTVSVVEDSKCDADIKFETEQNCTGVETCQGDWFTGPWSQCSKPCGGGEKSRKVICMMNNETTAVSNCDENSLPFASESCNVHSCGPDDVTPIDPSHRITDDGEEREDDGDDDEYEEVDCDSTGEDDVVKPTSPIVPPSWFSDILSSPSVSEAPDASSSVAPSSEESVTSEASISSAGSSISTDGVSEESSAAVSDTSDVTTASAIISSDGSSIIDVSSTIASPAAQGSSSSPLDQEDTSETSVVTGASSSGTEVTDDETEVSTEAAVSSASEQSESGAPEVTTASASEGTASDSASETDSVETSSSSSATETDASTETETTVDSSTEETTVAQTDDSETTSETTTDALLTLGPRLKEPGPSGGDDEETTEEPPTTQESSTFLSSLSSLFGIVSSTTESAASLESSTTSEEDVATTIISDGTSSDTDESSMAVSVSEASTETSASILDSSSTPLPDVSSLADTEASSDGSTVSSDGVSTETSVSGSTDAEEGLSSTVSGSSTLDEIWGSSVSAIVDSKSTKKKCRRKKKPSCSKSEFGCCPDKKTPAQGPFSKGCESPETCLDSKYGCCEDGVSAAEGKDGAGCPQIKCGETLFGCCPDKVSAAQGNDYEGCPEDELLPIACASSQFGCCPDGTTPASGKNNKGCFECEGSGECDSCNSTKFGCCEDGLRAATGPNFDGCEEGSGFPSDCAQSTYGCCPDGILPADGPNFENCGDAEPSNCTNSVYGCCSDGETPAIGNNNEGCPSACASEPHGCCPDKVTPAHGPNREGCCLSSPYGCCPDNILEAHGPNNEGCGCQYSPFGCCPDNSTAARGHNNAGCGCQYTEHKCCPDQYTPAAGPDFQGCPCYTFQFGCCPDGVTKALGPQRLGCGCDNTEFGCCPDGKTPANGTNQAGCSCEASRFGCCPDGKSEAQGEKFEGCTIIPFNAGEACKLEKDRGPGRDFTVFWFYDTEYGGCSRFWYGGRDGNANRFKTQEECKQVCVEPPGKAKCSLPKVVGPCEGYHPRWYYDTERGQCGQFIYGGCLGNNNNFEAREDCQKECAADQISDVCEQPIEEGPCDGKFTRWGFNKEQKTCEEFTYGGCKANGNNFPSQSACVEQCLQPGRRKGVKDECYLEKNPGPCNGAVFRWYYDIRSGECRRFLYGGCKGNANRFRSETDCLARCQSRGVYKPPIEIEKNEEATTEEVTRDSCLLPREPGICNERVPKWYFDNGENRCMPFYYTGCGGNENSFDSQEACEQSCPPTVEKDLCMLPALVGECYNYTEAWYYDSIGKRCKPFYYGGCGGNRNNFPNEQACRTRCDPSLPPEEMPEQRFRTEFCFEDRDTGPCREFTLQWHYDRSDGVCKQFQYGGCDGNNNRFPSRPDCEQHCGAAQDVCELPQTVGPCRGRIQRWYYDPPTDSCYEFEYGGCQGNGNNFDNQGDCEGRCRRGPPPPPPVVVTSLPPVNPPDPSDICSIPVDPGQCLMSVPSWYFDVNTLRCQAFVYGGCEGNANRFETEEQCERQCGRFRGQDFCNLPYESGPCAGEFRKFYYEPRLRQCLEFQYGGCEGNSNRFSSVQECETLCLHREEVIPPSNDSLSHHAICNLPEDTGACEKPAYKRWVYDSNSHSCRPFLYCGYGGNLNRFKSFDTCIKFCNVPLRDTKLPPVLQPPPPAEYDPNQIDVGQCIEARDECARLQCPYGIEKNVDEENCERCRCHDPCRDYRCPQGSKCAVDLYRDESSVIQAQPICREVNKPGECPNLAVGSGTCSEECVSDADCPSNSKCCSTGCGSSCVQPAPPREEQPEPTKTRVQQPGGQSPIIQVGDTNVTAQEGSYATLRCIVRGVPTPVITWRKAGNIIDGSGGRHRFLGDGSLQIIGVYRSDAGVYYCSADNQVGYPVQREFMLTVTEPRPEPAAVVSDENTYVVVTMGAPTVLQCYAIGWPRPSVTWWRGNRTLPSVSVQYERRRDHSLLIKKVVLSDLGPYVCQAYNGLGKAASGVVVLQAIGPVFTSNPDDQQFTKYLVNAPTAPDSQRAPLPSPPVKVPPRPRPQPPPEVARPPPAPPVPYQPEPPYEPPYEPPAPPAPPPVVTSAPVIDEPRTYVVPVRTNITIESSTFPEGADLSIPCDVEGYPYPQVRWYKEDTPLQPGGRITISESNRLAITQTSAADSGTYRCEASNQYGSSSDSVVITFEGVYIHPNCTDNYFFADCHLIVKANYCTHKYYAKFCCKSCTLAGQLPTAGAHLN